MATSAGKAQISPAEGATAHTTTGDCKPLHRFLRGEPKCVGIVLMFMGSCLFMFGIPLKMDTAETSADIYSSFWLGILYFTCGLLYVLAERQPTKKIVTASFALSVISTLGTVVAAIDFIKAMIILSDIQGYNYYSGYDGSFPPYEENFTHMSTAVMQHYMPLYSLEAVFLFHSLLGGIILITMTVFARLSLRSSRTQVVVVMRNLSSTE